MPRRRFERARKPEEKEVRRQAILKAARALLSEGDAKDISLNELARRSGISKPNVYRYFESREHVLLQLWIDEVRALGEVLQRRFESIPIGNEAKVINALVEAFVEQPLMCELTSIVSPVLEHNLSADAVFEAKSTLGTLTLHIAEQIHQRLPAIDLATSAWVAATCATWVAGIWPSVRPPASVTEALSRPGLSEMRIDFARDFTRFVKVLFAGIHREKAR